MLKKLNEFETDPSVKLVILKVIKTLRWFILVKKKFNHVLIFLIMQGNGKAFCSGGDIVDLYGNSPPGDKISADLFIHTYTAINTYICLNMLTINQGSGA